MSIVVWVFLGVVAVVVVAAIATFNRLVGLRNRFRNAFAQIDVQLKRRHDLIPNLVETAKAYMAHERQTLESVVAARQTAVGAAARAAAQPGQPEAMRGLAAAEAGLTGALGRLFAVAEAYPAIDACLVASRDEGGPRAVLESMATRTPLVTTRVGQAADLVVHGENGWMVEPGDVEGLVAWTLHVAEAGATALDGLLDAGRSLAEARSYEALRPRWRTLLDGFVALPAH